jgi:large subunit ribosomal protein L15
LGTIQQLVEDKNLTKVTIADLIAAGLVSSKVLVKVLAKGELTAKVDVEAHAFSQKAEAIITEKGGNAVKL